MAFLRREGGGEGQDVGGGHSGGRSGRLRSWMFGRASVGEKSEEELSCAMESSRGDSEKSWDAMWVLCGLTGRGWDAMGDLDEMF